MRNSRGFTKRAGPAAMILVIFLAVPGEGLYAKNRGRGAELVVQQKGGSFSRGELLAVRERSLILFDEVSGADVVIAIEDIDALKVVRGPLLSPPFTIGALLAGTAASILGGSAESWAIPARVGAGVAGGAIALLGFASLVWGADEIAVLKGSSEKRKTFALKKLAGMAFFPGTPPAGFEAFRKSFRPRSSPSGKGERFRDLADSRPPRFHASFEPFYALSQRAGPYMDAFAAMGFGDTDPGITIWNHTSWPTGYPHEKRGSARSLRGARVEYSLTPSFAVGIAYGYIGSGETHGFRMVSVPGMPETWWSPADHSEVFLWEKRKNDAFFLSAAWMPLPDAFFSRVALKLGVELGACVSRLDFSTSEGISDAAVDIRALRITAPAAGAFGEISYWFRQNISLGVRAGYRIARVRVGSFVLNGTYRDLDEEAGIIHSRLAVTVPSLRMDAGGPSVGLGLGLHF